MPYRFATEKKDYSDFASGRVFYGAPGHPVFPVRLISEVFQRCQAIRQNAGQTQPATVYDPCCGSGYQLSTLAYLHRPEIGAIIGSDIDPVILETAERNLGLINQAGLKKRIVELEHMREEFSKESHTAALESAQRFASQQHPPVKTTIFRADGTSLADLKHHLNKLTIDIVLADVPYGKRAVWKSDSAHSRAADGSLLTLLLDSLLSMVSTETVVAIMVDKGQKCTHPSYVRLEKFQVGKRRVFLLRPKLDQ